MARVIKLPTHEDNHGTLTVMEEGIPFDIKRIFYIYDMDQTVRGKHRHKKTIQALVCLSGACKVRCQNKHSTQTFNLDSPEICLVVEPEDYHEIFGFEKHSILLVAASEKYDPSDYVKEPYPTNS